MTTKANLVERLIPQLETGEPDNLTVVEAVYAIAARVRRAKRSEREPVIVCRDGHRTLTVYSHTLVHEHLGGPPDTVVIRAVGEVPEEPRPVLNSEGSIVIDNDDGHVWRWPQIREGLLQGLRAIPPSKSPKPTLCSECGKRIIR